MNCPSWEERILQYLEGEADAEAAEHLLACRACAAFAAELAEDARVLRMAPPEVAAVDYAALRTAARREAARRKWRPTVLAAMAVAAAVLLAIRLPLPRDLPPTAHITPAPPAGQVAQVAPEKPKRTAVPSDAPRSTVRAARRSRPKSEPDIDRQFAEYIRSIDDLHRPATPPAAESPMVMRIATKDPKVTIIWLEESKGNPNE
jgi:hypothetical protein